jgi:hypothetical protein
LRHAYTPNALNSWHLGEARGARLHRLLLRTPRHTHARARTPPKTHRLSALASTRSAPRRSSSWRGWRQQ